MNLFGTRRSRVTYVVEVVDNVSIDSTHQAKIDPHHITWERGYRVPDLAGCL